MPRSARVTISGYPQHIINRAVMRLQIFKSDEDYALFERLISESADKTGMRILAYCLMPNHWHLLLHPQANGELSTFMHLLTNRHTRQVHTRTCTIGSGPLYQGRYKSFLIESDPHLLTCLKYVERNAVRAGLVTQTEAWQWGSAWRRVHGTEQQRKLLADLPIPLPSPYAAWINTPETAEGLRQLRRSVVKSTPYGSETWIERVTAAYGLGQTHRGVGRPRK